MELQLLTLEAIDMLRAEARRPGGLVPYETSAPEVVAADLRPSRIDVGPVPELLSGTTGNDLAEREVTNARRIFAWLNGISPALATDAALWTTLCHREFAIYSASRWRVSTLRTVLDRRFVNGVGLAALRRNAVARLWWAAYVTFKPWERDESLRTLRNVDEWIYLKVLFGNQDIYQGLFERSFGSDRRILVALLEVFRRVQERDGEVTSEAVTRLLKAVNLQASYRELGLLQVADLIGSFEQLASGD